MVLYKCLLIIITFDNISHTTWGGLLASKSCTAIKFIYYKLQTDKRLYEGYDNSAWKGSCKVQDGRET